MQTETLYQDVARRITSMIDDGTLRAGERIPSVRKLHHNWQVSIATVLEAYRLLESRGVVEARPQSGYYVKSSGRAELPEPVSAPSSRRPQPVEVSSLALRLNAAAQEKNVVRLGAAVPDARLLPLRTLNRLASEISRKHPEDVHAYAIPPGAESLRREIARRMVEAGCALGPDEIVITTGAQEAVYLSLRALTEPGDTVAVESPTFFGLLETLEALHLKALELRTDPRNGIDLDDLRQALEKGRVKACALVTSFSNPLGSAMDEAKKRKLAKLLAEFDVPLVEDDVYGELPFEGRRPRAVKSYDTSGRVLYCGSFSKTLSPGLRVGWVSAGRHSARVMQLKLVTSVASATLPQLTVAAFLHSGGYERHLKKLRQAYRENVESMSWAVSRHFPSGTKLSRPTGGHVLWVELADGVSSLDLYREACQRGVSIAPGSLFSPDPERYRHCFRLNCGIPWSPEVDRAVETLGKIVAKYAAT